MPAEPPSIHRARVTWDVNREDIRAHTVELADQTLAASSAAAFGGDPDKADPEELFVASLSSCHMLWFLDLARRKKLRVLTYEDEAEGSMDGTQFTRVVLRPRVSFDSDPGAERITDLHHLAHRRCFIANSVSCSVVVDPRF